MKHILVHIIVLINIAIDLEFASSKSIFLRWCILKNKLEKGKTEIKELPKLLSDEKIQNVSRNVST